MKNNPWAIWEWLFSIILWWAHVTVTPDVKRIAVFNNGTWNGLKINTPKGGHMLPNSIVGDRLLWKKAQKKLTKKKISDTINRIIPQRSPNSTGSVCRPWKVPSREISRHHWYIVKIVIIFPNKNRELSYWWNHFTKPETMVKAPIAPVRGHGL